MSRIGATVGGTVSAAAAGRNRDDIGGVCTDELMAERSVAPSATEGWTRDAWPFEVEGGWIHHRIATSTGGETTGSVFRTG